MRLDMLAWDYHFGGANDGVFHPPAASFAVLVEQREIETPQGEVLVADVTPHAADGGEAMHVGEYVVTDFTERTQGGVWNVDLGARDRAGIGRSLSLLGSPRALLLTVRGGNPGNVVSLQLGSHFQAFGRVLGTLDGGEQTFTVPAPPEGWRYWGGENDGEVRPPLRFEALILERGDGPAAPTAVELGALRCTTAVPTSQPVTLLADVAALGGDGEEPTLDAACRAWNLLDTPLTGTLTITVRDWEGAAFSESVRSWTLPAKGMPTEAGMSLPLPADRNFAEVAFRFEAEGCALTTAVAAYTRPLEAPGDPVLRPESPWGMGVYLYRYPDNPDGHTQMDRAAALAEQAGVKWSREEFSWARIETAPGEYDFGFYDTVVDTAQRHGISVYGLLAYWSRWTEPYTERGIDDFCRFARAVVGHFKDRIKHWEVYNEPNIFFWSGPPELYPVLLDRCYAAIKEADPEAHVLGISTSGIDTEFIQDCLEHGAPFDVLTIHPYRGYLSERTFMKELREVAAQVGNRPVWITEMGWSTQVGGRSERAQAQLLARTYLSAVASGACQNISWYDFRCDGDNRYYNEHNFGVLAHDFRQKPAYRALAAVCRTFRAGDVRRVDFGAGVLGLQNADATALLSAAGARRVTFRVDPATTHIRNLMNEPLPLPEKRDRVEFLLKPDAPIFIHGSFDLLGEPEPVEYEQARAEITI